MTLSIADEVNEKNVNNILLEALMSSEYPNNPTQEIRFRVWEFDRSLQTIFLAVPVNFSEEERVFLMNYIRANLNKKLVLGIIKNEKIFKQNPKLKKSKAR